MSVAADLPDGISNCPPQGTARSQPQPTARIRMTSRQVGATKTEIERAIKGAIAGGLSPERVEVEGRKIVIYGAGASSNDNASDLDEWRRTNGEG